MGHLRMDRSSRQRKGKEKKDVQARRANVGIRGCRRRYVPDCGGKAKRRNESPAAMRVLSLSFVLRIPPTAVSLSSGVARDLLLPFFVALLRVSVGSSIVWWEALDLFGW